MDSGGEGRTPTDGVADRTDIPLHSTNLLTLLETDGTIRYESPAIERLFGYDPAALVGDSVADYFHPDDREAVVAAFRSAVETDHYATESVEYRHRRADDSYCWVESVTSTRPTPEGYYVVNTRDISESKARERRLRRANERLEEFATVVSHDLRNPLQVAQGRLELAAAEYDSVHHAPIRRAHTRMQTLIEELLGLAHGDGAIDEMGPLDLGALVTDCWETVDTGSATLRSDADGHIQADASRLRQLVENLIRNAVEHGSTSNRTQSDDAVEQAGPAVTVTVGRLDDGFYVADDGPGIDEAARRRIFQLGYSGATDGTGVGLRIVDQVSQAHGWDVAVTESDAGGARFEVTGVEYLDPR